MPPSPSYVLHASAMACFSAISLRSFTISLWISSSSFLAFRAFLLSSSSTWSLASDRIDFFRDCSCLWSSNAFWRLIRFSFTWEGENEQKSKQMQKAEEIEAHCTLTGWVTIHLSHEASNPTHSWYWLVLLSDQQKTQFKSEVKPVLLGVSKLRHYCHGGFSCKSLEASVSTLIL